MAATEFLLLNGAKVDIKDDRGQTPLHHATLNGHTGSAVVISHVILSPLHILSLVFLSSDCLVLFPYSQVCQLLKRSANQHAVDENGQVKTFSTCF